MITYDEAFAADEFHISHAGLPCTVWHRSGGTHSELYEGHFLIPVERTGEDGNGDWHHITRVNAADFHTPASCPLRVREDRPPGSRTIPLPGLDDGYDEDGRDPEGYDRQGFDANGYNRNGDNADGYNRDTAPGDLDLRELWDSFTRYRSAWSSITQADFREHVRAMLPGCPAPADDIGFCDECRAPEWDEDLRSASDGDMSICSSCWDNWVTCDRCDEKYPPSNLTETISGSDICNSCRSGYYSYCDYCDGWYHDEDAGEHDHDNDRSGCCESPQQEFTIRNDGCEPLANDTRVTVTLPAGVISAEGILAISRYLQSHDLYLYSQDFEALGPQWQTKGGNFTKRLSRHAFQRKGIKITPEVLSQVGCLARDHSMAASTTEIDVTRDLNQDASYFYHSCSCWWGDFAESRCALKTNGGFGLRSFSDYGVTGRAWVMPLRLNKDGRLVPTFETMTPDAFAVFNGYGDLSGYVPARIMAHMTGWTYRKIEFKCPPMYVNPGGYLIAPEELAEQYTDGSLHLSVREHSSLFHAEQNQREAVNA